MIVNVSYQSKALKALDAKMAVLRGRGAKIAAEAQHGLIAQVLKDIIFSTRPGAPTSTVPASDIIDATMAEA